MHTTSCNHITPSHYTTALYHRITSPHYTIALRHCITPSHYVTASHHCAITHEAPEAPTTHLGDITILYRSTTGPRDTLGRRYSPKTFPNSSARHSRATLQPQNVPQQFCAAPLGDTLPLFRRRNVRIDPVMNKPGDSFGTLGRHYSLKVFPNRAMRHSRATLLPQNVPQQGRAISLGDIKAP